MPNRDPVGSLATADIKLFESGNLVDTTIICGERQWKVHKLILVTRSSWFRAALCGSMVEATSGRIVLEEQQADVIDILLRFIYSGDIDLKTPTDGKDLPALCVKVFRAGDFFLLDDLKRKATTELEAHLQNTTKSINNVADNGRSPEWLTEVFEALKEAYKDMSTEPMVKAMLSFVYLNKRKIFRFQDVMDLVQGTPAMAVDLMRNHLIDDLVTRPAKAALQLGIPVLAAVELPTRMYDISNAALRPRDLCEMPCLLYPVVDGFSSISSIFTTVIPETETTIESLRWMAPIPEEIKSITSNDDSDVVCVERETFLTQRRWMYLRFEDCKGAKAYVDRYCRENPNISRISQTTAILSKKMQLKMNTTPPDGHSS